MSLQEKDTVASEAVRPQADAHTQSAAQSEAQAVLAAAGKMDADAVRSPGPSVTLQGMPAPHTVHDDPLLACLVEITRIHGNPLTAQALSSGLPLVNQRLTPSLLARAAQRAHCTARVVRRHLDHLPADLLPAIVLLKGDRAALLLQVQADGRLLVQYPESEGAVLVEREV